MSRFLIIDASGCSVASAGTRSRNYDMDELEAEQKANAHLIAAAPDLLEALKAILSDEMRDHKAVYEFGGFVLPDELRNQAAAAIAKAEGRSE